MSTASIPQPSDASKVIVATGKQGKATTSLKTPTELADKYTFIEELGRGTQGHVYKTIRKRDNQFFAIKQLRIDSIQTWKEYDLFMREAETLKALNIPGVVKFEEACQFLDIEHPAAYIVQEYIQGRSLGEMMRSNYRFSTQQIFKFAIKLLTILKELHHHDPPIIHRDIKPSNLLFVPQETGDDFDLYLIDFGAVANPHVQSGGSTVAGTFGYMPPEQLMGKPCPASDVYALGATIAYMLSGIEPGSMQVSSFRLIIEPHLEAIPKKVVATLRQMLDPDLSQRLCDYDELILRFKQYANNLFTISQSDVPVQFNIDWDEKLKAVTNYCQEGNIEIWDMLSDRTPRVIPTVYQSLNTNAMPEVFSINDTISKLLPSWYTKEDIIFMIFSTIVVLGVGGCVLCLIIFLLHDIINLIISIIVDNESSRAWSILITIIICTSVLIVILAKSCLGKKRYLHRVDEFSSQLNTYLSKMNQQHNTYLLLLGSGFKTIATVVEVSYECVNAPLVEHYNYTETIIHRNVKTSKYDYEHKKSEFAGGYCHQQATFTIRYKFNPPDDSSPYDLVHEITTYSDCEDKLKPGDLIPILYYINPDNNREVWSTPFPLPYTDFWNYDNIVGFSCDRRLKKSLETKT